MKYKKEHIFFLISLFIFLINSCCVMYIKNINAIETTFIINIQNFFQWIPNEVAIEISKFAHGTYITSLIWIAIIFCLCKKKIKEGMVIYLASHLIDKFSFIIKGFVERPRPPYELQVVPAKLFSYPAGHCALCITFYGLLLYYLWKKTKNKKIRISFTFIIILLLLLVAFSRIFLGAHYPTDIIGGYSLGICGICLAIILDKYLRKEEKENTNIS